MDIPSPAPAAASPPPGHGRQGFLLLWIANAVVANAVALLLGVGGLRSPSTAVNLATALLLVALPLLVPGCRLICRRDGRSGSHGVATGLLLGLILGLNLLVVALALALVLFGLVCLLLALSGPERLARAVAAAPSGMLLLLAVLPCVHWIRSPWRWLGLLRRLLRAFAWLPPCCLLSQLAFLVLWTPGAWIGDDPMFEEVRRLECGHRSYVAVRVNVAAFAPFRMQIMEVTPVVPGLLTWWRRVAGPQRARNAELSVGDGELQIVFDPQLDGGQRVSVPLR